MANGRRLLSQAAALGLRPVQIQVPDVRSPQLCGIGASAARVAAHADVLGRCVAGAIVAAVTARAQDDREAIAEIVAVFFGAFTSGPESAARLDRLRTLFLPGAVVVRTCGAEPLLYDVEAFLAPRQALLSGGSLTEFREWELAGDTVVFGDVASHVCSYAKSGVQEGKPFTGGGMKVLQLVRTSAAWRISAAAWDDERDGVTLTQR